MCVLTATLIAPPVNLNVRSSRVALEMSFDCLDTSEYAGDED